MLQVIIPLLTPACLITVVSSLLYQQSEKGASWPPNVHLNLLSYCRKACLYYTDAAIYDIIMSQNSRSFIDGLRVW